MQHPAVVAKNASDDAPLSDRALELRAGLQGARFDLTLGYLRLRRAVDSPNREEEAAAAEALANAAGRVAGFARLLAAELASGR